MDNRYNNYNCPPLMNDGRFISNYVRSSTFDQYIRKQNNIIGSHDFRHHLQTNGNNIINNIKSYYRVNNTCNVQGRCLPSSVTNINNNNPSIIPSDVQVPWYEELLDDSLVQDKFTNYE